MPVIDQITTAADRIFDSAESANKRARTATTDFVTRAQEGELPFADRLPSVDLSNLPLVDRLPEPVEAVNSTFDLIDSGIEFNRSLAERVVDLLGSTADNATDTATELKDEAAKATKKAPAKKATAKK